MGGVMGGVMGGEAFREHKYGCSERKPQLDMCGTLAE